MAASHSGLETTKVASGKSEIALAWSMCRWVITTAFTSAAWMPRARSWAASACSGFISMSLKVNCESRPRFCVGLTATEAWKPVSISTGPAPGCSTRKAGTGTASQSSRFTPSPKARRQAMRPSSRRNQASGPRILPVSSGCSRTVAPWRPPGSGSSAGRGSAAVVMGGP